MIELDFLWKVGEFDTPYETKLLIFELISMSLILKPNSISKPINLSPISSYRSYWATHFYAILNCLYKHKGLEYSFLKLDSNPKTLATMRGSLPYNFFFKIKQHIINWGFQYYLVNFLNYQNGSKFIVERLITEIEYRYNVVFSNYLENYKFYVSGQDSELLSQLHKIEFDIFPKGKYILEYERNNILRFSDLCLLLTDEQGSKVGIFGEVEGLRGNSLKKISYWEGKQDAIVFGLGVSQNSQNDQITYDYYNHKIIITFDVKNQIITDFYDVIDTFEHIFLSYPNCRSLYKRIPSYAEFDFFLDLIIKNWNKPIGILLFELEDYIHPDDIVGDVQEQNLSIITDIRA